MEYLCLKYRLRRHGLFKDFHPPTAMISTFPSMSDIAWADIFDTPPPPGVNQLHFNPLQNRTIGTVLSDLNSQRDFEQRFQVSHADPIHHTRAYIDYAETARQEAPRYRAQLPKSQRKRALFAPHTPTSDVFMHSSFESLGLSSRGSRSVPDQSAEKKILKKQDELCV